MPSTSLMKVFLTTLALWRTHVLGQTTGQPSRHPISQPSQAPHPTVAPTPPALPTLRDGSIAFDTTETLTAATITVNFTVMWDLRADEIIQIFLPRFTRRLADDMKLPETAMPTRSPTAVPTRSPQFSFPPTPAPSPASPTAPTVPTLQPPTTAVPTAVPTPRPTPAPTVVSTPSGQPTGQPTAQPSRQPTRRPSAQPTGQPSRQPSRQPTRQPTSQPSGRPTVEYYPRHASLAPLRQPTTVRPTQLYELKGRPLDIALGSLILAPSTLFLGAWTEGEWRNYNASHAETNYPGGMITLSRAPNVNMTNSPDSGWIKMNTVISLKVYRENGIGAYCGFPGSASPDSATHFASNVNHGGLNANLYDRDERFLILTNYSLWPTEGQYPIKNWPNNLYNGLKSRLLPNVSYYVPNWPSMGQGCSQLKPSGGCSGHGQCDWCKETCSCFDGWGSSMDILTGGLKAPPDCSLRTCPSGSALSDMPVTPTVAHRLAECSNAGRCNRQTGECECFPPWTGAACDRMRCPNDCSGHGKCLSIRQIARLASMTGGHHLGVYYGHFINYGLGFLPSYATDPYSLDNATHISNQNTHQDRTGPSAYEQEEETAWFSSAESTAWDKDRMRACVCDSSWPVGLELDQRQLSEWFGPDCSLRHCPSGDDPFTARNELHCNGINQLSASYPEKGHIGNYCQIDCSNRGVCDYSTGKCTCFEGSYGDNCAVTARTGIYADAASAPDEEYLPPFDGPYEDPSYATQQIELARFY